MERPLEIVSKYIYLGSAISGDGDGVEEIRKRLAVAMHKLTKMKFLWKGQNAQTKLRILRACFFSVATYGCDAWMLGKTNLKRISAFKMKCYRKILRISWTEHGTNKSITEELPSRRTIAREFCEETKAEIFWSFEKKWGIGEDYLRRKDKWEKKKRKTKKAMGKGHRGCFQQANKRRWKISIKERFRSVVKDATSIG